MRTLPQRNNFSNLQLELLKVFTHELNEFDLIELKKRLAAFFSDRLIAKADKAWEEKDWNDTQIEELLNSKLRKRNK